MFGVGVSTELVFTTKPFGVLIAFAAENSP
jgi:hypothetical protein